MDRLCRTQAEDSSWAVASTAEETRMVILSRRLVDYQILHKRSNSREEHRGLPASTCELRG
jgi:hypothetical protein